MNARSSCVRSGVEPTKDEVNTESGFSFDELWSSGVAKPKARLREPWVNARLKGNGATANSGQSKRISLGIFCRRSAAPKLS